MNWTEWTALRCVVYVGSLDGSFPFPLIRRKVKVCVAVRFDCCLGSIICEII